MVGGGLVGVRGESASGEGRKGKEREEVEDRRRA